VRNHLVTHIVTERLHMSSRKRPRDRETTGASEGVRSRPRLPPTLVGPRINVEDLAHSAAALRKSSQDVFHLSQSGLARLPRQSMLIRYRPGVRT
jgi:hypothetical protein